LDRQKKNTIIADSAHAADRQERVPRRGHGILGSVPRKEVIRGKFKDANAVGHIVSLVRLMPLRVKVVGVSWAVVSRDKLEHVIAHAEEGVHEFEPALHGIVTSLHER